MVFNCCGIDPEVGRLDTDKQYREYSLYATALQIDRCLCTNYRLEGMIKVTPIKAYTICHLEVSNPEQS